MGLGLIVQPNDVVAELPGLADAVTVTVQWPATVGAPVIRPDELLSDRPLGSSLAL